jgi:signal transduction histidine kinase
VLVVDDQEETLVSSRLLLEREGHRVLTAQSGADALSYFRIGPVDLLIVDYFMPGMSGEDLVVEIRKLDEEVQIILQTGYSGEKPPREMLKLLDIQGYHDKSEGPDRLLLWVDVALKAAAQMRKIRDKERDLTRSRSQLRQLSARLLTLQEDERERISRELHDQLGQLLTALGLDLDWCVRHGPEKLQERLREAVRLTQQAIAETRELCSTLRPGDLQGVQLADALKTYASEFAARSGITISLNDKAGELKLPREAGRNLYRIAQEALSNVGRHAHATHVEIELARVDGKLAMSIADDGKGFDPGAITDAHAIGLIGMRERARLIGATVEVHSAPGSGTTIRLELPMSPARNDH